MEDDEEARGKRLKSALGERSNAWLAKQVGVVASTVHGYVHGKVPPADVTLRICDTLDIDIRWYISGEGAPASVSDDIVNVPVLDRTGKIMDDPLGYSKKLLSALTKDHARARCLIATGEAMKPVIPEHAEVLFLLGQEIVDGMAHVIRIRDRLVVRRIRMGVDGTSEAFCDNPAFAREAADPVSDDQIVGRVIWISHAA
ncbi:hypothetical protein G6L37_02140 [Agrobacterium rubi]|nr:hypothetical protein [Agrobacterium rubi]NTF24194.1 hypothetical protein [Agrobacterium rubi]